MGFMRKAAIISTGGVARAAIKPNSKKERTANAAEKALKLQKAEAKRARSAERLASLQQAKAARSGRTAAPVEVSPDHVCEMCGKRGHDRSFHVPGAYRPSTAASKPAAPQAAPSAAKPVDSIEQLRQLGNLRDAGVLTDEEFAAKKAEILGRI